MERMQKVCAVAGRLYRLAVCNLQWTGLGALLALCVLIPDRANVSGAMIVDTTSVYWLDRDYYWYRLACNLIAYSTVLGPLFLLYRWLRYSGRLARIESHAATSVERLLALLYVSRPAGELPTSASAASHDANAFRNPFLRWCKPSVREYALLLFCAAGLQLSYLTWGIMQERIMTRPYRRVDDDQTDTFGDSQFLVFVNRLSAFALSGFSILLLYKRQPMHSAALYKYSFASLSNIMSAWCQYEALKFVSFPTQTLGKACKIIPVMLMGRVVSHKSYPTHQYATAAMISAGVTLFLLSRGETQHSPRGFKGHGVRTPAEHTSIAGLLLMGGYLTLDAFTSNWQGRLFSVHRMSSLQMMCGVNVFSVSLTLVSLVEQGTFWHSLEFVLSHQHIVWDSALMALCSAVGQLFIFYTISQFGAVTFTIIMTIRMALSIILSCLVYGHQLSAAGLLGFGVTFAGLFLRTYIDYRTRNKTKNTPKKRVTIVANGDDEGGGGGESDTDKRPLIRPI